MTEQNANLALNMNQALSQEVASNQFLTFKLGGENYGVDILQVQEIKAWTPVNVVPNTPKSIKGVLNLRGEIVPIIDLRAQFGFEDPSYTSLTVIIVLSIIDANDKPRTIGVVADSVSDVVDINEDNLKPKPDLGEDVNTSYIRNVAIVEENMIMLLDINLLINTSTIDETLAGADAEAETDQSNCK